MNRVELDYATERRLRPRPWLVRVLLGFVDHLWGSLIAVLLIVGMIAIPAFLIDRFWLGFAVSVAYGVGVYYA